MSRYSPSFRFAVVLSSLQNSESRLGGAVWQTRVSCAATQLDHLDCLSEHAETDGIVPPSMFLQSSLSPVVRAPFLVTSSWATGTVRKIQDCRAGVPEPVSVLPGCHDHISLILATSFSLDGSICVVLERMVCGRRVEGLSFVHDAPRIVVSASSADVCVITPPRSTSNLPTSAPMHSTGLIHHDNTVHSTAHDERSIAESFST